MKPLEVMFKLHHGTRQCGVRAPGRGAQRAGGSPFPAARPGAGVSSLTPRFLPDAAPPAELRAGGWREGTAGLAGTGADRRAARLSALARLAGCKVQETPPGS